MGSGTICWVRRFPLTLFCTLLIWVLCLISPPKTGWEEIKDSDKIAHIVMYLGSMIVFWWEYWRKPLPRFSRLQTILFTLCAPIAMSGLIELIQEYCTFGRRSGDIHDFMANSVGVILAFVIGRYIVGHYISKQG